MSVLPPQRITYFDTPDLSVHVDLSRKLMVVQGKGMVSSTNYRKGLSLAIELAKKEQLLFWLVNNRLGGIISTEDQMWACEVANPKIAHETQIIKMALIEPADTFSKLILEDLVNKAWELFPFEMQFFEREQDALAWFEDANPRTEL
ncbi:MAG: STAS/SEC14 domain-containing protein [Hymenobacteraceae bacterium]|nr:STAS/SEC14 domain-containing protein [Hymenobacteraceae bacterium]